MLKKLTFLLGLAGGFGGASVWLLSESAQSQVADGSPIEMLKAHLQLARERFSEAVDEGKARGGEVENRLHHELDAYRLHPDRPAVS